MSSLRAWFRGTGADPPKSSSSSRSSTPQPNGGAVTPAEQKIADIEDAMLSTGLIMNDDPEGAEARLLKRKDATSFHQLGLGVSTFMRSILGFEKEVMALAASRLQDCENKAWADKEKAEKKGGDPGQVYPAGSEFALVYAEALLMNAILSIIHESLTDAIKGFYKLRKAFAVLNGIVTAEERILQSRGAVNVSAIDAANGAVGRKPLRRVSSEAMPGSFDDAEFADYGVGPMSPNETKETGIEDDEFEFVDAPEHISGTQTPASKPGKVGKPDPPSRAETDWSSSGLDKELGDLKVTDASDRPDSESPGPAKSPTSPGVQQPPTAADVFTHPVDVFVHSGTNMCFGILLLLLSMIPPAFGRLLSIIGFKGDRERGVRMLWQSTAYPNVNGAVAAMVLLGYYNGMLRSADLLPSERDIAELSAPGEMVGFPHEQCAVLLQRMRERYPDSRYWKLEEARTLSHAMRLREAADLLTANSDSKMRQVAALNAFELALHAMFLMDWPRMRTAFLRMVELNDWSHTLYYYIAGCAEVEMYRDAAKALEALKVKEEQDGISDTKHSAAELEASARQHKKAAEDLFRKAPTTAGRKRFMSRQMPFEVFVLRKLAKWEERAAALGGIDLADAIGVSPAQEMIYIWNGPRRMTPDLAREAIKGLDWERCTLPSDKVANIRQEVDESAIHVLCNAALLREAGETEEARSLLEPLAKQDRSLFKGGNKDDYVLASTHYELAVLAWTEACSPEKWPEDANEVDDFRRKKTDECASYLDAVANWEAYVLDARFGMKVRPGLDSIAWLRRKKGWTT